MSDQSSSSKGSGPLNVASRSTAATKTIIRSVLDLMMSNKLLNRDTKTAKFDDDLKELIREIEVVIRTNMLNYGNEVAEKTKAEAPASGGVQKARKETGNRHKFLLRLIAGRFSHLFADPKQAIFPRNVVMGFDDYLLKLLGEVLYSELNTESQELLSWFDTDDDGIIWKEISKNDRHKRFAYNIVIRILMKFEDFSWAKRNFISIVNNVTERRAGFLFEDRHFNILFTALFSDIFRALWDDEESLKLDFMFGNGTVDKIEEIRTAFKESREQTDDTPVAAYVGSS